MNSCSTGYRNTDHTIHLIRTSHGEQRASRARSRGGRRSPSYYPVVAGAAGWKEEIAAVARRRAAWRAAADSRAVRAGVRRGGRRLPPPARPHRRRKLRAHASNTDTRVHTCWMLLRNPLIDRTADGAWLYGKQR